MAFELKNADWMLDDDNDNQQITEGENGYIEPTSSNFSDPTDIIDDNDGNEGEGNEGSYETSAIEDFLIERGIEDPTRIKFENEDGEIEERNFNDLSKEEQRNILEQLSTPDITEEEFNLLNYMRGNNLTIEQMMENYAAQKVREYAENNPTEQTIDYSIDDFSDEQLYIADLKNKYPNFSDEELLIKLQKAEENEELFVKEVAALREEYKALEDQERQNAAYKEQQEYEDLRNNLAQAVGSFNEFALDYNDPQSDSLVIEDADKQQMLSYLLDQDANGKSQLVRDLEDPDALAEIALLRVKGAEFLAGTTRYYKNELAKAHKEINKLRGQLDKSSSKTTVVKQAESPVYRRDEGIHANYFDKLI